MAIILVGGTITPVLSQSVPESNIVINEIETNSYNGSEFVEIYNAGSETVDVSGWEIVPLSYWKKYVIEPNTLIAPNSFLAFSYQNSWLNEYGESISLIDSSGNLVDQTPKFVDSDNDSKTWQRSTDGLDTESISDWTLKTMSPKASNGKIIESQEINYTFTGQTDKPQYTFGDTITISGSTTENLFSDKNESIPEVIAIKIQGPNYYDKLTMYPDRFLNFKTTLYVQELLGFNVGTYNVEFSYGENLVKTQFTISEDVIISEDIQNESPSVIISTDKATYLTGEKVTMYGDSNNSERINELEYSVFDPNGKQIHQGKIYPNPNFSTVRTSGGGEIYAFSTQFLMSGVNPIFGTYEINGTYSMKDSSDESKIIKIDVNTSFKLVEEIKEDIPISLSTDKDIYEVGEKIKITGRSNEIWTEDVELSIIQTSMLESMASYQSFSPVNEKISVKLDGYGNFVYFYQIPKTTESNLTYGSYLIKVSEYFGETSKRITVVENAETYVDIKTPLGLYLDKSEYVIGTPLTIYGQIKNYEKNDNSFNYGNEIKFTLTDSKGIFLMSQDRTTVTNDYGKSPNQKLTFTALPDDLGNFQISTVLHPIQFELGKYTVIANHYSSKISESVEFEIVTAQSQILEPTEIQEPLKFEICSSTSHHETIKKDLVKIGKGEIPASMETVDCSNKKDFITGEKLVIRGNVVLKQTTYLDDSSVKPSGSTMTGHSYTTNMADAENNFIELSIPYPQTLVVSTSYRTIPVEGEDYHGGGGTGSASTSDETTGSYVGTGSKSNNAGPSERHTGYNAQIILRDVTKNLTDMNIKAYPDDDGYFTAIFDLRPGVFVDGFYKIKADYFGYKFEDSFFVSDTSLKGGDKPSLSLDFDKIEYVPGDLVRISGLIKNVYYYDPVAIEIETPTFSSKVNCLIGQSCDMGNTAKKIRVSEGTKGAEFFMNYPLPEHAPVGKYTVSADTHFGIIEKSFFVSNESDVVSSNVDTSSKLSKSIEKFNRISGNVIPITLDEKTTEESILHPRVIQGSLFTSARGAESEINLQISTPDGQCVIGQSPDCLVKDSTRKPGEIYSVVTLDEINYKIRYSGPDVRLEKFSILPEEPNSKITIDNWNIEIIKDEQPTRFYYKVSYVELE